MNILFKFKALGWPVFLASLLITIVIYAPGLSGGYLFDDFPNIVDNHGVQPSDGSIPSLISAALSSPSSDFKRPLASLSFAFNFLANGLDPYGMKLTNLVIHLLNGLLVFLLARKLLSAAHQTNSTSAKTKGIDAQNLDSSSLIAALIALGWMLLPINLTCVLYIVQRMESLANIFVLLGLIGYITGRQRMLGAQDAALTLSASAPVRFKHYTAGLALCIFSIIVGSAIGLLAKETAVMLPLYACTVEWLLFRFRKRDDSRDWPLVTFFVLALLVPMCAGLAWLLPNLLQDSTWASRNFTLHTRLMSEARIVIDYVGWTLLPTPTALSFYHDDYVVSRGILTPWTTLASVLALMSLTFLAWTLKRRQPLVALGILWFLGAHLLTATILPLELVYEHRNYFASFGLLLAIVPPLTAVPSLSPGGETLALPRRVLLGALLLLWAGTTYFTANAWRSPLSLAIDLAARAPQSPRALYELGRTYILYSHYDPSSPFTRRAYVPLEKASMLPGSSILPEQALIFMNSRMGLPLKGAWWQTMEAKLRERRPGVQDESSLDALYQCAREGACHLEQKNLQAAFEAAMSHPDPSPRLLAIYGGYAWNILGDRDLGCHLTSQAASKASHEPAYKVTLIRMLLALNRPEEAKSVYAQLQALNIGGNLDRTLAELKQMPGWQ